MRNPVDLLRALQANPSAFDFFAALRLLECAHPDQPRIGQSQRIQDDVMRFAQAPSMAFEPSMLAQVSSANDGESHRLAARMEVNFFGLFGPNGPLPAHLTEYARERIRNDNDPTLARFLDVFHHRMISLFYRSWASAQPVVHLDRPASDRFALYAGALSGRGMSTVREHDEVSDNAKFHFTGRLAAQTHNAEGLGALLGDFFQTQVRVQEFVGRWIALAADDHCYLQTSPGAKALGLGTVLGTQVWNCQHNFRLVMGPLSLEQFKRMLPGGSSLQRLVAWVRNYVGLALHWDLNLVLQKQEVPQLRLGQAQLGWTSWLLSREPAQDDRQLVFVAKRARQTEVGLCVQ